MNIGNNRICFFDDAFLDTDKTTAEFRLHEPVRRETVLSMDTPCEGDCCNYLNLFFDDAWKGVDGGNPEGSYRLYYLGWTRPDGNPEAVNLGIRVCYAESADGIRFVRPSLGISLFDGNRDNNIILGKEEFPHIRFDNFMVFRDDNPACPADKRYKGILAYIENANLKYRRLYCFYSADGLRFREGDMITDLGWFDSLNVVFWDSSRQIYRGYIRSFHAADGSELPKGVRHYDDVRDIRYIESKDFVSWTEPERLEYGDNFDFQLYTNNVIPYFRARDLYLGFPTIYTERQEWTPAYDELCGAEARKKKMQGLRREGLALTDNLFMVSHDGKRFYRHPEAFMRPMPEQGANWIYGDCYMARGVFRTRSDIPGAPDEMSMYLHTHYGDCIKCDRYTLRLDGFCSLHAGYAEKTVTTKPFTFAGDTLYANIETSAKGHVLFSLLCGEERYDSCEYFGNHPDKKVVFAGIPTAALAGREVTMVIRLLDADIYSFRFGSDADGNLDRTV